jgi:hypothetical protein
MMAPGEGDALVRYSPLFLPDAVAAVERGRTEGLTLSISGVELQTSGGGDRRTLTPVSFVVDGTVPSTWGVVMDADPTIPTVIYTDDGRIAIVPAGAPIPATIDEVELVTELPPELLQDRYNTTFVLPDGTIQPIEFPTSASEGPQPFRLERRDGCTELTGPGIDELFPGIGEWAAQAGTSYSEVDGGHQICGGPNPLVVSIFSSVLLAPGFPMELPSISVVESDGLWYVSPIGTLGASVVDMFRSVPDGANLIDTPLAAVLFQGMDRQTMNVTLAARTTVPPECDPVVALDADGVPTVIPDPPVGDIRACVRALFTATTDSGSFVPAPTVDIEAAVPASTNPPGEVDVGG